MSHGTAHAFRISTLILALIAAIALALPGIAWADNNSKQNALTTSSLSTSDTEGDQTETPSVGVSYRVNFTKSGWSAWAADNAIAGKPSKHRRAKAFQIALETGSYQGVIQYRVRLTNGKWKAWKTGSVATGKYKNVEAIQIRLKGDIAKKYDVVYRVNVQDIGWQRRMRNGETAGSKGSGQRIEALRVQLVSKKRKAGWIKSKGNWSFYRSGKKVTNTWLDTDESPIDITYAGKHRYWLDSRGILAVDRFVNPNSTYDAAAGYPAFASLSGYVLCGKFDLGSGILLADNTTGELYAKTRWLTTDQFDGSEQRYRLVKRGFYAVVKTGAFTVKGKRYYAYEDGRGYVMRNDIGWVDGTWKIANKNGVLKKYTGSTSKIIEKYVKWAIATANDDSHGYSQAVRWGPDYDCSSFVCSSLLAAGFPDSGASWTGNMKSCLKRIGFKWHKGTKGLKRGDIMFVHNSAHQHTEIYLGKKKLVGAHSSENGGIYGAAGDQTGREISITRYYNMPWQGYFRYKA